MDARASLPAVALALLVGCGGGSAPLAYGLPDPDRVTYLYGDTTIVSVETMGQTMQIALRGEAEYGVAFAAALDGVGVTLTVDRLTANLAIPMAAPIGIDEDEIDGPLVFTLDRKGRATVESLPTVADAATSMVSGIAMAHTFFPRLPNRPVATGDEWVDTVAYEGDDALASTESTVLRYRVVGDTVVTGRDLVKIVLEGTSSVSNAMDMGGMRVSQSSTIELEGWVLWDVRSGLMFEMVTEGAGPGTVRVPMSPTPLPIEVRTRQRARLAG